MAEENLTINKENTLEEGDKNENGPEISGIRTLESDIADYTKEKNFSVLDIVAEEAKVRGLSFENPETEENFFSKYKKNIAVLIIFAVILGAGYLGASMWFKGNMTASVLPQDKISEGPILADNRIEVQTYQDRKDVFLDKIEKALGEDNTGFKLAEISLIKTENGGKLSLNKDEFFAVAGIDAPKSLSDFLAKNFMLLNFKSDGDYPILVFKVSSYNYVFSEMLKWERKMPDNLGSVFPQTSFVAENIFIDKYIQNHDARVLENNGETSLMYSIADRKYLIIANNENALAEIFKRFSSVNYANPKAEW